jgi:Sec-independent protein translocase protein TatA
MEYVIYTLVGLAVILFGMNKWNAIKRKSAEAKLLIKDADTKDAELRTKQEELKKDQEALKKEHEEKLESAKGDSAEDFWKKRLK